MKGMTGEVLNIQHENTHQGQDTRRRLNAILAGIVGLLLLSTAVATILLWPKADQVVQQTAVSNTGGEVVVARVTDVTEVRCPGYDTPSANQSTDADADAKQCLELRAELSSGESVTFSLDSFGTKTLSIHEGDTVHLVEQRLNTGEATETSYAFYDYPRGGKLALVAIVFALIVVLVGRWRGALALVGVGAAVTLLVTFILPAILAGEPPILVAVTGATAIMILVLYLAHGISHRTTAALFGSIFGILFTAFAGFTITHWLRFTGIGSSEDAALLIAVPGLHMNDVLTATIVIAGLGVLNDITVAQASTVWEMRALNPELSRRQIYLSAMGVGRDHIASSIYTLVFAYAGAMLVVLLLLYTYPRDLIELITSEQIGQEVVRTLIGATGLVLSMPITTAFAVFFARPPVVAQQ